MKNQKTPHSQDQASDPKVFLKGQAALAGRDIRYAFILAMANGLLLIMGAWYLSRIVDQAIFQHADLARVAPDFLIIVMLYIVRAALVSGAEYFSVRGAMKVKTILRHNLIDSLRAKGPIQLRNEQTGTLLNTLIGGLDALQGYYSRYLPAMTTTVFLPVAVLVFVVPVDWVSALVMLVTAPMIPAFMILIGKGTEALNRKQWRKLAYLSGHFLDVIQGLTTLKLFNASRRESAMIGRVCDEYRRDTMAVLRVAFLSSLALEFFATVSIAIVAVLIGFRLLWGEISFHQAFFVLLLAPEFYLPLRRMGVYYHTRMDAIGAAEKIVSLMTSLPALPPTTALSGLSSLHIRFDHVTFAYAPGQEVLQDISFDILPGGRLALVGPSGSGKSTILSLLLGFIQPQSGQILINDIPLQSISPDTWWAMLGWVPQKPRLFSGTLFENIRIGRASATDAEIQGLSHDLHIDFLDRHVGEDGKGLSGGQIQRIALARALIRPTPLLILDEPTASLDPETESVIRNILDHRPVGQAMVVAAHKLHTIEQANQILVLDHGVILSRGRHADLVRESAYYRSCLTLLSEEDTA